jgi:uridylate kinase|tara:strand:- start:42 stop:755 length:714 start_codon:yes stop_codon:yes gene_type:complete
MNKYKRILIKMSGEALMGDSSYNIDLDIVSKLAISIKDIIESKIEVSIVIGGGNIFRGLSASLKGMDRTTADHIGMLATTMNSLALQNALEKVGCSTRVMSAIPMHNICEPYIRRKAIRHMEKKRVVIFASGTGNPYFTTDTAAALRASEMSCDAIFKATKVDGVYDSDPKKVPDAKKLEKLTYVDVLTKDLKVMDASAISVARENNIPIIIFSLNTDNWLSKIINGNGPFSTIADS